MPSVHIAWSSAVAFFVWRSTTSRWRYLGVVHALLTWTVVVATGNHYWLDGVVAIVLLVLSFWTVRLGHRVATRVTQWLTWTPVVPAQLGSQLPAPSSPSSPDAAAPEAIPARASPPSH
jgi:hypothetical protein